MDRVGFSWLAAVVLPAAALIGLDRGPFGSTTWGGPHAEFALVVAASVIALVATTTVMVLGFRRDLAEVALLGAGLSCLSGLLLVHGLTTPGVLYGPNTATATSVFVGVPIALFTCVAIVFPRSELGVTVGRWWKPWSISLVGATAGFATLLLARPSVLPAPPGPSSAAVFWVALACVFASIRISWRHVEIYRIGGRVGSLVGAASMAQLGAVMLVFTVHTSFSPAWWLAHVLGFTAIYAGCAGVASAYRANPVVDEVVYPVLSHDPMVALELTLSPCIRDFVAALGQKDELTREHVVRVAELAMRVGARARLRGEELRTLGLGALLHDVGKLLVPDEILAKPAALTDHEANVIRTHPIDGARLLTEASDALKPVAPLVRWHHERWDGTGYPDHVGGQDLPISAMIISVCDAWDAMTALRVYRDPMPIERARAILRDGAGTQWNSACVELLLEEVEAHGQVTEPVLASVGRAARDEALADLADCCTA